MTTQIFVKELQLKRQNTFWYYNLGEIAKFTQGDRQIIVTVFGEIMVKFKEIF